MLWIGLTGGIATGKSTVAELIKERGFSVIDADKIVHKLLEPRQKAFDEVVKLFSEQLLDKNQCIDRKKLGEIVFQDPEKLIILENILHPKVQDQVKQERLELEKADHRLSFYEVPLLFEKKLQNQFDRTLLVTCDITTQKHRLMSRENISSDDAEKRIALQMPLDQKLKFSDDVIDNNKTLDHLKMQVDKLLSHDNYTKTNSIK